MLCSCLETQCPATHLRCKADIDIAADSLVNTISEVIEEMVPISKPSPYAKHWWTKELMELKKTKNRLSNLSYRLQGLPEAPAHAQHRDTTRELCHRIEEIKKNHWSDWLEEATPKDIYIANKYITNSPSNYANARIPSLKSPNPTRPNVSANTNLEKANELASVFFPPPPANPSIPAMAFPKPLKPYSTC